MAARRVVVTGAGSGIGRAVAERLARDGDRVLGTVRSAERAAELTRAAGAAGLPLRFAPLELTEPASVAELVAAVEADGGVDVLVLNAGCGVFGSVEELDDAVVARQFAVNLLGPLTLARRLLPLLRARRGRVIWVGSLAGRLALPFQAHYSATKAAIAAVSDALRMELAPFGVSVTCVEPADVATGFTTARERCAPAGSPYADRVGRCLAAVERGEVAAPGPERVGRRIARLSRSRCPPARLPVGPFAGAIALLHRLLPDRAREWLVRRTYRVG